MIYINVEDVNLCYEKKCIYNTYNYNIFILV